MFRSEAPRRRGARERPALRLIACRTCHTQYDVSEVAEKTFACRCGEPLENRPQTAVDAQIRRCASCGALVGEGADACSYCGSAIVRERNALSLLCPECFARNAERARFCAACGVAFRPEPIGEESEELPCPCCSMQMGVRRIGGLGVSECPGCNGLWVPGDRFELLVERAIASQKERGALAVGEAKPRNPAEKPLAYRKCPACGAFMLRQNFRKRSGVVVDWCRDHGTWLDADELEQIAAFILGGGLDAPGGSGTEPRPARGPGSPEARAAAEVMRIAARHREPELRGPIAAGAGASTVMELFNLLFD